MTKLSDFTLEEQQIMRQIQNSMAIEGFEISDERMMKYAKEVFEKLRSGEIDFDAELAAFRAKQAS